MRAILPNEQAPILRLRADFLGVVDFGAKRVSFDASLVDSRVLQFALTGDAAFRLYQGNNPVFLLTSGGFHPSFQPPANADLPTLRRLTLALAQGNDFRLTLSSYVAITANTVQFGSRLDLYVNLPGSYYIAGFLSFDALFQFNPFRIAVQVAAGVAIKKGNSTKLSIHLRLNVTGPAPWHIDGEGSFKILFFKIKFRVNRTFGQGAAPQPLPDTDVRRLLLDALRDPKSWEVQVPAVRPANLVVLRAETDPEKLLVDPGGALSVRQRVVPLAYRLERFGNTRPTPGNEFNISSATVGATNPLPVQGSSLEYLNDHFAPGQFRTMSDQQKLSAPSFQSMRSGIRLGLVDGLSGGSFVTRTVQYEVRIAHSAPATTAGRSASSSNGTATEEGTTTFAAGGGAGETQVTALPRITFPDQLSRRLARNGAVGRTARSYEQRRPSRKAPDKVFWDEDTYAVVSVRDLLPHVATPFPNEASATQYMADAMAAAPELTDELQVIPSYQLPASVTSSNVAFA
ncbi:hypothetical protein GCM10023185_33240 [Hymenobacter saemangeumensis]|uniref:DUF6603 domain-containing protein n=1 Tax=Hymenobacter saemangeumensis TaxID=1084522 RepID=A0ABP8IN77_9BACT